MPVKDIRDLREQIKAKRPDWDDAKLDEATKSIYMKNPGIVDGAQQMTPPPSDQMKPQSITPAQPEPSLGDQIGSSMSKISNFLTPSANANEMPPEQHISLNQDDARKQAIQALGSNKQITSDSDKADDAQAGFRKAFNY